MDINTLQNICDLSDNLMVIIDKEQKYRYFNKPFFSFVFQNLGIGIKLGDSFQEFAECFPNYYTKFIERYKRALNGEVFEINGQQILTENQKFQYTVKYGPTVTGKNEIDGVYIIFTLLDEQVYLQEQLNERTIYLKNVLDALDSSAMVSISDIDGKIESVNEIFCNISGYSREELIGQSHELLYATKEGNEDLIEMKNIVAEKHIWQKEMKMISKSGIIYWTDTTVKPILDESGTIIKYISIRYDITSRKQAEEKLIETEQRWNYALISNQDGVWDWDFNNQNIYYTPQWKKLLGYSDHELENKLDVWSELVHPDDKETSDMELQKHIRGDAEFYLNEHRLRCKDGSYLWVLDRGKIIEYNEDGSPKRMVGTHTNINRQKQQEQIIRDNEALLNQFLDNMPIGVSIFDKEGTCIRTNKSIGNVFGIENYSYAVGRFNIFSEKKKYNSSFFNAYEKCLKTKEIIRFLYKMDMPTHSNEWNVSKTIIYINITFFPILDEQKNVKLIYGLFEDITEQELSKINLEKSKSLLSETGTLAKIAGWEIIVDKDPYKLNWSDELYLITELEPGEEISISRVLHLFPDKHSLILENALQKCIEKGDAFDFELPMITAKGNSIMTRVIGNAELKSKHVHRIHGVFQDITEQHTIRKELSRNTRLMHSLFDSIDMGYMAFDKNKVCNFVNKRINLLYADIDFIGKSIYEIFPEVRGTEIEKKFEEVLESNESQSFEADFSFLNGRHEFTINPIGNEGAGVFARNISARYALQQEINRANSQLHTVNEYLSNQNKQLEEFTHIVSHNLRSPVANLNALIKLYEQSESDAERVNYIDMLREVINSATNTLDELIDVVQVKKDVNKEKEIILFVDSLNKTRDLLSADIERTKANIISNFTSAPSIKYPKIYLDSIIQNLISNAIKYKNPDRAPVILIESYIENNIVKLRVKDNGLGIDLERNGDKIFGFRKTFHKHPDAKGLGLFITRNQIETLGGKIYVESKPNIGTTFTIEF